MGDISGDYANTTVEEEEESRIHPWEAGLPNFSDLPPLTKGLIPPELLSAFNIRPEPYRTPSDVTRASQDTVSTVRSSKEERESESKKPRRTPRLVWTPQLHKRFVQVVAHLGIQNAVPKTIMKLMNVEGLTRENVASHLQKYRLYLKRMHGPSNEEEKLFASSAPMIGMGIGKGMGTCTGIGNYMNVYESYQHYHDHDHYYHHHYYQHLAPHAPGRN